MLVKLVILGNIPDTNKNKKVGKNIMSSKRYLKFNSFLNVAIKHVKSAIFRKLCKICGGKLFRHAV